MDSFLTFLVFYGAKEYSMEPHNLFRHPENRDRAVESSVRTKASQDRIDFSVVVNFDVIAWFTHNAKLRLIANCRLRDHSRITHYPFTQSLQKLPLPTFHHGVVVDTSIEQWTNEEYVSSVIGNNQRFHSMAFFFRYSVLSDTLRLGVEHRGSRHHLL